MAQHFNILPSDVREQIQMNAGVLLSNFDPTDPYKTPSDSDIIAVTTGGINPVCTPTTADLFEDVDNAPNNTMEGFQITGYTCTMGFTSIKFNAANIAWAVGASDTTTLSNGAKKIVPRRDVDLADFRDIWWVSDKLNVGAIAICLKNAISTGGLNIQSTKNGKGTSQTTLTGFVSAADVSKAPMEFYEIPPEGGSVDADIQLNYHSISVPADGNVTLVASVYPLGSTVTWTSDDDTVATVAGGVVTGESAGNTIITAAITVDGVTFNDTCTVVVTE
jgi:hypothetical protein